MGKRDTEWSHDWAHFNFSGVKLTTEEDADGITTLSPKEMQEYLQWMAITEPRRYGRMMMDLLGRAKRRKR